MQRLAYESLVSWASDQKHEPLLLRGARQVGKTHLAKMLGKNYFNGNMVVLNFELNPEYKAFFDTLDPASIIQRVTALTRKTIIPGKTLLFLDEVQECPQALTALRYFKENMLSLHVIAAGSLLELILNDDELSMPVGRIQSMYIKPLSFQEYLLAQGYKQLLDALNKVTIQSGIPLVIHQSLIEQLRDYFIVGGMPEVVSDYLQYHDLVKMQAKHAALMTTYRNDFGKYASKTKHRIMQAILDKTPGLVGTQIKYVKLEPHSNSRELKEAIQLLCDARIIQRIYHTNGSGLPLKSLINEKLFKLLFLDVGLMQSSYFLDPKLLLKEDLMLLNRGALTEQFAGQELLANLPNYLPGELFYWQREKVGSQAEVDYVINIDQYIIPIEVKSGKTGTLRSLHQFLNDKQAPFGIRLSTMPLSFENNVLSIPLYCIHELPRLARDVLSDYVS